METDQNPLSDIAAAVRWRLLRAAGKARKKINWCTGRLLEIKGNVVHIDGCSFSIDSPEIATELKSQFVFDTYEQPEREGVRRFLNPKLPVVELGGSIGVVSCLTNRRLHDRTKHIVVEANPGIVPLLERNRAMNQCDFTILSRVIAYGQTCMPFYANTTHFLGSSAVFAAEAAKVETIKRVMVETTNLQSIVDDYGFERCTLICDIEGGESELLRHESEVIRTRVSTIMMEVHEYFLGTERVRQILTEIEGLGFRQVFYSGETYIFQQRAETDLH